MWNMVRYLKDSHLWHYSKKSYTIVTFDSRIAYTYTCDEHRTNLINCWQRFARRYSHVEQSVGIFNDMLAKRYNYDTCDCRI